MLIYHISIIVRSFVLSGSSSALFSASGPLFAQFLGELFPFALFKSSYVQLKGRTATFFASLIFFCLPSVFFLRHSSNAFCCFSVCSLVLLSASSASFLSISALFLSSCTFFILLSSSFFFIASISDFLLASFSLSLLSSSSCSFFSSSAFSFFLSSTLRMYSCNACSAFSFLVRSSSCLCFSSSSFCALILVSCSCSFLLISSCFAWMTRLSSCTNSSAFILPAKSLCGGSRSYWENSLLRAISLEFCGRSLLSVAWFSCSLACTVFSALSVSFDVASFSFRLELLFAVSFCAVSCSLASFLIVSRRSTRSATCASFIKDPSKTSLISFPTAFLST
eukprot:TRINITY_DN8487_c0_g1_i3.p1 TRINITY_DN8487_c0_g1~~TRINITY_DN8487_c0_g1_i3.p1  ORF type:complete len:337 (+),score=-16.78 TRINITY_DN8487_c0_g1_i3:348-1358(+)